MGLGYPLVRGEAETLRRVLAGASLARYGDGEFKHCADQRNVSQVHHPRLSARLREILVDSGSCMVGIPNRNPEARAAQSEQKRTFWDGYAYVTQWLAPRPYASAFLSRPDSAPWIDTPEYWAELEQLWRGKEVTLVRGSEKSLTAADLGGADVREILAPRQHAWAGYDALLREIGTPKRALLCLGPTATVLAVDLCAKGVHAVDLGHVGMFWRKHRRGEPMTLSKDDRSYEKVRA